MIEDEIFESISENGHRIRIDMRKSDVQENQSPVELLLSAVAGCGAVDIVSMLRKRKRTIARFEIESTGARHDEIPRRFTKIHCHYKLTSPDANEQELYKLAKLSLEKYCSVASSLKAEITFSVSVVSGN